MMKFINFHWVSYPDYQDTHDLMAHYVDSLNPQGEIVVGTAILMTDKKWHPSTIFNRNEWRSFEILDECKKCVDNAVEWCNGILCPEVKCVP